jgi:hypothetical protein
MVMYRNAAAGEIAERVGYSVREVKKVWGRNESTFGAAFAVPWTPVAIFPVNRSQKSGTTPIFARRACLTISAGYSKILQCFVLPVLLRAHEPPQELALEENP